MDKFLPYLISHNTVIIEVLIGCTLVFSLFLAIRTFLFAKEPEGASLAGLGDLEATLKKILEQASQVPNAGVMAAAGSSEEGQKLVTEIAQLKTELQAKQAQIEEMKTTSGAGATASPPGAAMSDDDKAKLEAQLKELQAKLAEYEIISEDIADLSFYKEQNAKLQKELDALKAGGAVAAPAAAAPAPAAPAAPVAEAPKPVEAAPPPAAPVVEAPKPVEAAPPPAAPAPAAAAEPAAPVENLIDDDLMAEFAAAVANQKAVEAPAPTPAAPAAAATAPAPPVEAAPVEAAPVEAAPVEAAPAAPSVEPVKAEAPPAAEPALPPVMDEPVVDLGTIDVDKMMAEAAQIKSDGPDINAEQALGTSLDENKLLQEATALQGVTSEDKQLMGQFENFVKKD